ncbi:MAG: ABC transporter substrate-binding protein [Betaproteobacteria bacterium]|nr:ABC transporter substrate-binding protein [Betaproteobacteria bacterium]
MDRRSFAKVAGGGLLVAATGARAQPAPRVRRLGILRPTAPFGDDRIANGIPRALAELGYVDGANLVLEQRYADGRAAALPALARELVALKPDAIVAVGAASARAAKDATATIPIVIYGNLDPVATGLAASLAQPGGNVTGVLIAADGTLAVKKLELLMETAPSAGRIALLAPSDPGFAQQLAEVHEAARALRADLVAIPVKGNDFEGAFAAIAAAGCRALFVGATTYFVIHRRPIIELALKHRIPAIWEWPEQVEDGGLMSYGGSLTDTYRRLALAVDQIFKGARVSMLPIDQQTKFRLVINQRTAKAIGLAIPRPIMLRADEVIT